MSSEEKFAPEQIIEALRASKGMVYIAADALGCTAKTVYNYIERYPEVKEARKAARGRTLDVGELKLFNAVERDEAWAIAFLLKTLGKERGYTERQEVSSDGNITIKVIYGDRKPGQPSSGKSGNE